MLYIVTFKYTSSVAQYEVMPWWCNGNTLAQNARDVGLIPAIGTTFPAVITSVALVSMAMSLNRPHAVWLLNLPCVHACKVIACICVIVTIERLPIDLAT